MFFKAANKLEIRNITAPAPDWLSAGMVWVRWDSARGDVIISTPGYDNDDNDGDEGESDVL